LGKGRKFDEDEDEDEGLVLLLYKPEEYIEGESDGGY
jgi:hypothetical protein